MDFTTQSKKIKCLKCGEEKYWIEFHNKRASSNNNTYNKGHSDICKKCSPRKTSERDKIRAPSYIDALRF